MSKQDRQGARTPADLERKYNFGQSFAEVMGLAQDAQDAAGRANEAAARAEGAVNGLTQEEIFNRLTKDGTMKGLYMENGELYINASYLKSGTISAELIDTVNLIAQKLQSVAGNSKVSIDGAKLVMNVGSNTALEMYSEDGLPILYLLDWEGGSKTNETEVSAHHLKVGGSSTMPIFYVSATSGVCKLGINGGTPKTLSWKANGDGTYSLVGT